MSYKKILCAMVAGLEEDEAILQAYLRARRYGASLAFLQILPDPEPASVLFPYFHERFALERSKWAARGMEDLAERVAQVTGRERESLNLNVEFGSPVGAILQKAEEWNCDLLVIPAPQKDHRDSPHLKFPAEQIVRHARCPVLLVKRGSHQKQVLAATDFSDPSLPAVAAAAEESQLGGSLLILMHSLDLIQTFTTEGMSGTIYPADFLSPGDWEVLAEQTRQHLREALQKVSAEGSTQVSQGQAGWAIVQKAEQLDAELIVVGTLGRTGLARFFLGSVCEFVIRHAPCSVLAVRLQN
jgi:nucleotide-binding universal stress UspA family protein